MGAGDRYTSPSYGASGINYGTSGNYGGYTSTYGSRSKGYNPSGSYPAQRSSRRFSFSDGATGPVSVRDRVNYYHDRYSRPPEYGRDRYSSMERSSNRSFSCNPYRRNSGYISEGGSTACNSWDRASTFSGRSAGSYKNPDLSPYAHSRSSRYDYESPYASPYGTYTRPVERQRSSNKESRKQHEDLPVRNQREHFQARKPNARGTSPTRNVVAEPKMQAMRSVSHEAKSTHTRSSSRETKTKAKPRRCRESREILDYTSTDTDDSSPEADKTDPLLKCVICRGTMTTIDDTKKTRREKREVDHANEVKSVSRTKRIRVPQRNLRVDRFGRITPNDAPKPLMVDCSVYVNMEQNERDVRRERIMAMAAAAMASSLAASVPQTNFSQYKEKFDTTPERLNRQQSYSDKSDVSKAKSWRESVYGDDVPSRPPREPPPDSGNRSGRHSHSRRDEGENSRPRSGRSRGSASRPSSREMLDDKPKRDKHSREEERSRSGYVTSSLTPENLSIKDSIDKVQSWRRNVSSDHIDSERSQRRSEHDRACSPSSKDRSRHSRSSTSQHANYTRQSSKREERINRQISRNDSNEDVFVVDDIDGQNKLPNKDFRKSDLNRAEKYNQKHEVPNRDNIKKQIERIEHSDKASKQMQVGSEGFMDESPNRLRRRTCRQSSTEKIQHNEASQASHAAKDDMNGQTSVCVNDEHQHASRLSTRQGSADNNRQQISHQSSRENRGNVRRQKNFETEEAISISRLGENNRNQRGKFDQPLAASTESLAKMSNTGSNAPTDRNYGESLPGAIDESMISSRPTLPSATHSAQERNDRKNRRQAAKEDLDALVDTAEAAQRNRNKVKKNYAFDALNKKIEKADTQRSCEEDLERRRRARAEAAAAREEQRKKEEAEKKRAERERSERTVVAAAEIAVTTTSAPLSKNDSIAITGRQKTDTKTSQFPRPEAPRPQAEIPRAEKIRSQVGGRHHPSIVSQQMRALLRDTRGKVTIRDILKLCEKEYGDRPIIPRLNDVDDTSFKGYRTVNEMLEAMGVDAKKLEDCALQIYRYNENQGDYGTYLDLESTIDEQNDEFEGFHDQRKNALILRTQLSVRVHCVIEKLLNSSGRELRRALFSLKQIFQDDKDLVHEFVNNDGLDCLLRVGADADQNYQNYILRALGQVMLYVDGMNGIIAHFDTIVWLYNLLGSKFRLVVKTALKLLLVFVEYTESNSLILLEAVDEADSLKGNHTWTNVMNILDEKDGADSELLIYTMTLVNKALNAVPDQDTFYDVTDALEELGMEHVTRKHMNKKGADLDLLTQFNIYEAALKYEDGEVNVSQKKNLRHTPRIKSEEERGRKSRRFCTSPQSSQKSQRAPADKLSPPDKSSGDKRTPQSKAPPEKITPLPKRTPKDDINERKNKYLAKIQPKEEPVPMPPKSKTADQKKSAPSPLQLNGTIEPPPKTSHSPSNRQERRQKQISQISELAAWQALQNYGKPNLSNDGIKYDDLVTLDEVCQMTGVNRDLKCVVDDNKVFLNKNANSNIKDKEMKHELNNSRCDTNSQDDVCFTSRSREGRDEAICQNQDSLSNQHFNHLQNRRSFESAQSNRISQDHEIGLQRSSHLQNLEILQREMEDRKLQRSKRNFDTRSALDVARDTSKYDRNPYFPKHISGDQQQFQSEPVSEGVYPFFLFDNTGKQPENIYTSRQDYRIDQKAASSEVCIDMSKHAFNHVGTASLDDSSEIFKKEPIGVIRKCDLSEIAVRCDSESVLLKKSNDDGSVVESDDNDQRTTSDYETVSVCSDSPCISKDLDTSSTKIDDFGSALENDGKFLVNQKPSVPELYKLDTTNKREQFDARNQHRGTFFIKMHDYLPSESSTDDFESQPYRDHHAEPSISNNYVHDCIVEDPMSRGMSDNKLILSSSGGISQLTSSEYVPNCMRHNGHDGDDQVILDQRHKFEKIEDNRQDNRNELDQSSQSHRPNDGNLANIRQKQLEDINNAYNEEPQKDLMSPVEERRGEDGNKRWMLYRISKKSEDLGDVPVATTASVAPSSISLPQVSDTAIIEKLEPQPRASDSHISSPQIELPHRPEVPKSESDIQWDELKGTLDRPLKINNMDFTDLGTEDDINIFVSVAQNLNGIPSPSPPFLNNGGIPPPPPPFGIVSSSPSVAPLPPPPPPFSGSIPPPPPPFTGSVPPPPPPLFGNTLSKQAEDNLPPPPGSTLKKSKKTLRLHWKNLNVNDVPALNSGKTIWKDVISVKLDPERLEQLFETKSSDPKAKESSQKQDNMKKEITVLDLKRSNLINIGMTVLPPPRAIKTAILKMDNTLMNREGIEKLITSMIPTEEEKNRILEAQMANSDVPLGRAEQFLLTLASISELKARLQLWLFKLDYETVEREIAEPLMDLKKGIEDLMVNKTFKYILSTILAVGNFLNGGQARAFSIEYLSKVPEVKDTVHKRTLLEHLCSIIMEQFPDSTDLYTDIAALTRCSKIDWDELVKKLDRMEVDCKRSWDHLRAIAKHDGSYAVSKTRNAEFVSDAAERIMVLKIVHKRVLNRFSKLLLYMGLPIHAAKLVTVSSFCKIIGEFALEYRTAREKVLQQLHKKATQRERKKTRGKMIVETAPFSQDATVKDDSLERLLRDGYASAEERGLPGQKTRRRFGKDPPMDSSCASLTTDSDVYDTCDDDILEACVRTATRPNTRAPKERKRSRSQRKSLRRTLKNGVDQEALKVILQTIDNV